MNTSRSPIPGATCMMAAVLLAFHAPAAAQTDGPSVPQGTAMWGLWNAIGYGRLGFGLGLIPAMDMGYGAAAITIAVTTAAGTYSGAMIGRRAGKTISEGGRLGGGHRAAVAGGAIMAGGTLGALAAVPLINPEGEGTIFGSDEATVAGMVLVGAALASVFVLSHRDELSSGRISVTPAVLGGVGYGLKARVAF